MIGSKNYQHAEHCISSFEAGKNVFCEKPLATTIEDCHRIQEAHKKSGKLFETGFVLRHAPLYTTIHEMLKDNKIGKIISVEANETLYPGHGGYIMSNWRRHYDQSGPHILEKCCHDIDILTWLIGSVPSYVCAFGGTDIYLPENAPEDESVRNLYRTWYSYEGIDPFESDKTIEDNLVAIMQFRNGVKCTFHTNCNTAWPQRRIMICGTKGTIEADLVTEKIKYQIIGEYEEKKLKLVTKGLHGGGDIRIIEDLVKCMVKNSTPKTTGEQGFVSAIICLGIDEARRKNEIVNLEPIWKRFDIDIPN